MANALDALTIKGFKSIQELDNFKLNKLNVLIGANGAGKSNFIEIFRMLRAMMDQNFAGYILDNGGSDDFLFNGPKRTSSIHAKFYFGQSEYEFELVPTVSEKFVIQREAQKHEQGNWQIISSNQYESQFSAVKEMPGIKSSEQGFAHGFGYYIYQAISDWIVYHFHDTSSSAPMRRSEIIEDNKQLRANAANLAPFLLYLRTQHEKYYREIVNVIQLVAPFFNDFILEVVKKGEKDTVKLNWKQKSSDYPMQPYHFSDGTIRFICLATALLQPNPPSTVVIDEPELGLHPYAIEILSELIQSAAEKTQLIISTQSPALIDCFSPKDIIVVNRKNGASIFERLDINALTSWLEDYSLGELWRKNVVTGGPVRE
jgi:predicted ATPase